MKIIEIKSKKLFVLMFPKKLLRKRIMWFFLAKLFIVQKVPLNVDKNMKMGT